MFKLFSKKKKVNEMAFLMDCMIEDCDDLLEDVDSLQCTVQESNKLLATIQQQCQEIIKKMENDEPAEKTLDTHYVRDEKGIITNIFTLAKRKDGNYVHVYDSMGTVDKVISINALIKIIAMDEKKLSQLFDGEGYESMQKRDEKRNYYIIKDDLGLVSKKAYIGEENGEEDKNV